MNIIFIFVNIFSICEFVLSAQGLYLEGGRWKRESECLDECLPRVQYDELPIITIEFTNTPTTFNETEHETPIYKTSDRNGYITNTGHSTHFIMGIGLKTMKPSSHWTIRGVAALCQLND